jgi:hypothetical protein
MKIEKIILSFFAVLVGLVAAGVAFYFYQMTKVIPANKTNTAMTPSKAPTPTPNTGNILTIDSPKNEAVSDKKTVSISGKTASNATVIVSTEDDDQVVKPASNGNYSVTASLPDGTTLLQVRAIFADGTEKALTQTVTYSTASF